MAKQILKGLQVANLKEVARYLLIYIPFNEEMCEERISHRRFRTIPDYSIVQACGHNILCVGGAVSIDRSFRKEHDSRNQSSDAASYWSDEMPMFDEPKLTEIDRQFKIDSVITHTAPSFCEQLSKAGLSEWAVRDAELLTDCEKERVFSLSSRAHHI